jgi:alcohol dehydrogenase class IV
MPIDLCHLLAGAPLTFVEPGLMMAATPVIEAAAPAATRPVRVLLVVGAGFIRRPWRDTVLAGLRPTRLASAVQVGLPTPESVARLARQARTHRAAALVAVGGGSVMDAAKCAAVLAGHPEPTPELVRRWCADGAPARGLPIVAVPTTPGTGAEATPFATVWDLRASRKLSLRGPGLLPAAAILDPDLLLGLPGTQLASCLLDILAQGIEGAWSTRADERAEALGRAAVTHLAGLLDHPPDGVGAAERCALLLAGHCSGRAIAIAGTTVCHALSYPLTLRYGLPHGHACGVTLAGMLRYNAAVGAVDCRDPRGPDRVRRAIAGVVTAAGADDVATLAHRVDTFLVAAGLRAGPDLGADAAWVVDEALGYDRAGNNPRELDRKKLVQFLTSAS